MKRYKEASKWMKYPHTKRYNQNIDYILNPKEYPGQRFYDTLSPVTENDLDQQIRKNWRQDEIEFVVENYGEITISEIAYHLGRKVWSVYGKIKQLDLPRKHPQNTRWTPEMDRIIVDNHGRLTYQEIADILQLDLRKVTNRVYELRRKGYNLPYIGNHWNPKT